MSKIGKRVCSKCGEKKKITKMEKETIPSRLPDKPPIEVWTCNACLGIKQEQKATAEAIKQKTYKKDREEEIRREPFPQSIQSDDRFEGYVHGKKNNLKIGEQERGSVTLDADRLNTYGKNVLGLELSKIIRQLTNHKCVEIKVKAIELEYIVKRKR